MNERIRKIQRDSGLNQKDFAKKLKLSPAAITYLIAGTKKPSADTLTNICLEFNIDGTWLLTGKYQNTDMRYNYLNETERRIIENILAEAEKRHIIKE